VTGRPRKQSGLPKLPAGGLVALWLASLAAAAPPAASVYSRTEPTARPADATEAAAQAERIVASALANLARAETVSLRLRQRVRLGNRVLVGAGRYLQAGKGEERRFRFDTTLTCDTESFEVTEVSDGLFFWSHRRIGADRSELQRVDMQRVRSRLAELEVADPDETAAYLGGLQRLLWWTRQWFWFEEAVPGEIEGRPVWFVTGHTPPTALTGVMPHLAEAAEEPGGIRPEALPDGWPFAVRLAVGRSDLLPHRIEFLGIPGTRPVAPAEIEPIAVVDLLEIEINGPVDAAAFFYQPATAGLIDVTNQHVSQLAPLRP
jgi:hypothetical protein